MFIANKVFRFSNELSEVETEKLTTLIVENIRESTGIQLVYKQKQHSKDGCLTFQRCSFR